MEPGKPADLTATHNMILKIIIKDTQKTKTAVQDEI